MNTAILALALLTPAAVPDAIDHLKTAPILPNVGLLLDSSCSMGYNPKIETTCTWWANSYNRGRLDFTKNQVMRSVLVGCETPNDGILDKWADRVNFSIYHFGQRIQRIAPFGSSLPALELAANGVPATGGTPMSAGLRDHGSYFTGYFRDNNTSVCRPNFLLLLSDGDPNGGAATFNFNCPQPGDPRERRRVSANRPWDGSGYMTEHRDFLCELEGDQKIRTYTLGFGAPGSFSPSNLQEIAHRGEGVYVYARDVHELDDAFEQIIHSMASRAGLFHAAAAVQVEGLFSANFVYANAFRPEAQGPWHGTIKKHCIRPRRMSDGRYDPTDATCVLRAAPDGKTLLTNPSAMDLWTGTTTTAATTGGTGAVMTAFLGRPGGAPKLPLRPRNIMTWLPDADRYTSVRPDLMSSEDTWTRPLETPKLINYLHGYTHAADANGDPVSVGMWAQGDSVHTTTLLLQYGDCAQVGQCWVVSGGNDGMLHFFDAANGEETSAIIPSELWKPNAVANHQIKDVPDQPTPWWTHRYYVDGGAVLFHVDDDGDGRIQPTERAELIVGLGRGGAGYYKIPVSQFNGRLEATHNPIQPLVHTPGTQLEELHDAWAAPWAGQVQLDGQTVNVAMFGSGHVNHFDDPGRAMPGLVPRRRVLEGDTKQKGCPSIANANGIGPHACETWVGHGYADPAPQDLSMGPFKVENAVAYRLRYNNLDIDPNDWLEVRDGGGHHVFRVPNSAPPSGWRSDWIYADSFELRFVTDGQETNHRGWRLAQIEYLIRAPETMVEHYPTVFLVDLDKWNGQAPRAFVAESSDQGVRLRITRDCKGNRGQSGPGACIDARQSPDLAEMTCPISGEITGHVVGGVLTAAYWGDECGQLWKAWQADGGTGTVWKARRLLRAHDESRSLANPRQSRGSSKDFRKLFRKLDIFPSQCSGRGAIGIAFGTGNVQRPVSNDDLENAALSSGRDVVGVLWDYEGLPSGLSLDDLAPVDGVDAIEPKLLAANQKYGWYLSLGPDERMLRDPLVFEGTAYFKTYVPTVGASECSRSRGDDHVYAVDVCTARAASDMDGDGNRGRGDRRAWTGNVDVGGNLLLVTPSDDAPIVSHANLTRSDIAHLRKERGPRVPRIFNWREPGRKSR